MARNEPLTAQEGCSPSGTGTHCFPFHSHLAGPMAGAKRPPVAACVSSHSPRASLKEELVRGLFRRLALPLTLFVSVCLSPDLSAAQGLTGQIGGSVVDSSKAVLPGATVTAKNVATAATGTSVTDANGAFVITNLLAGTYDVRVTLPSFKTYEQKGVVLSATERVSLPPITLEVGGVTETISVQAEAAKIQTQSGERSAVISADQIEDVGLRG